MIGFLEDSIKGQDKAGKWISKDENEWSIWVIDGAYPLGEEKAESVEALSSEISDSLSRVYNENGILDTRIILQKTIDMLPIMKATATLTIAQSNGQIITVGDSEALLENGKRIIAPDFSDSDKNILSIIKARLESGWDNEKAYFSLLDVLIHYRNTRNEINGSGWIIGEKNRDKIHEYAHVDYFNPKESIILFTDGIARLIDRKITENLFEIIKLKEIEKTVKQLRQIEESDPDKTKYVRFSISDDASLAWSLAK